MSFFAQRCGLHDDAREHATEDLLARVKDAGVDMVRIGWCDVHGLVRGKAVVASQLEKVLRDGISMVSTLMLKDSSDRTAYKVFQPGGTENLAGFSQANNLILLPDPSSFVQLPWAQGVGWVRAQPWFEDGGAVALDTRRVLQRALGRLQQAGYAMRCGLEVEFHIYRITDTTPQLDPVRAHWPGEPPQVQMIHPGYALLSEVWLDMAEEPLRIVQHTAQALGLPLVSLELEFGPSQVEAVFDVDDALRAADNMVLFRSAVKMALRRAGYHASFVCRPPFPNIMSSGWHLHQSLVDVNTGANALVRASPAPGSTPMDVGHCMSEIGEHYLAGLLAHASGMAVFCTPTVNGYGRYGPNALAPQAALWGRDNRGAMLRVVGSCGDVATRIENRIGEPAANPYLYMASQIHAGLDGMGRSLQAPPATNDPYAPHAKKLPTSLSQALEALQADAQLCAGFGQDFVDYYLRIKRSELDRFDAAVDKDEFQRREYFSRL